MAKDRELRVPALEIRQGPNRRLYSFAIDGKQLPLFSTVSRVKRGERKELIGYQRPEVLSHIASIKRYLESEEPMIPNALVIAFDNSVRFVPLETGTGRSMVRHGALIIPIKDVPDEEKPGWIVDGQQRAAAIREARVEKFPICVTGFITDSQEEQRAQFILVNSTKPLPKGLIYELLPSTEGRLPVALQLRQFPATLLERLNLDADSPLRGMIRTPTTPDGQIKDNSVLRMIENSLTDGALYYFRNPRTGRGNANRMLKVIKTYWAAVQEVFSGAWNLPPRRSRLMHGVGIAAMGFLMDAIFEELQEEDISHEEFVDEVSSIADFCAWTSGSWKLKGSVRKWNELQNTPRDIQLLTVSLLDCYYGQLDQRSRRGA